jgi:hypothetical protein
MLPLLRSIVALFLLLTAARAAPVNDNFAGRLTLAGALPLSTTGTNAAATAEPGEYGAPLATSVWYRWTAPATRAVRVTAAGALPGLVNVFRDTGTLPDSLDAFVNPRQGHLAARAWSTFHAREGQTYAFQIIGEGAFSLLLEPVDWLINEVDVNTEGPSPAPQMIDSAATVFKAPGAGTRRIPAPSRCMAPNPISKCT